MASQTLSADHFGHSAAGCLLGKAGRARYYGAYEQHIPALRQALRESVRALARQVAPQLPEPGIYEPPWIASPHESLPPAGEG